MKNSTIKILIILLPLAVLGQTSSQKEINEQVQTWFSLNTVTKFSDHWGVIADVHIRRNDFLAEDSFYLVRAGMTYIPTNTFTITAGYAHMWLAPSNPDWSTFTDENRIYEQLQLNTKAGDVGIVQRLRIEQRWQEKTINDEVTEDIRFTNRLRYLIGFNIPVFKKKTLPLLVISDEILLQFGEEVVYNTFDQNRLFIGIKQTINPKWSFDFGYMNVYQEKYSGYQYDMNHTIRLFFYLSTSIRKKVPSDVNYFGDE